MDIRVLVFALSMFLAFDYGEGISCHICNGYEDAKCKDPFGPEAASGELIPHREFLKDCNSKDAKDEQGIPDGVTATMCRKIYQDVRGDVRVIRGCAWEEYTRLGEKESQKNICYKTVMEEYNTYVCTCDNEEGCNGAKITQVSTLLMVALPLITFGIFHQ